MSKIQYVYTSPNMLDNNYYVSSVTSYASTKPPKLGRGQYFKIKKFDNTTAYTTVNIVKVIYNDPATIVFWSDGTKTVAKCHDGDEYDCEKGLAICVLKMLTSGTAVREMFEDWLPDDGGIEVTLKDVKRKNKQNK